MISFQFKYKKKLNAVPKHPFGRYFSIFSTIMSIFALQFESVALTELITQYSRHPSSAKLLHYLSGNHKPKAHCTGLSGSSRSLLAASVIPKIAGLHLIILPEKEDAAYFYNDLVNLLGSETVLFFPSSFKRSVQYNQIDNGNVILRTM